MGTNTRDVYIIPGLHALQVVPRVLGLGEFWYSIKQSHKQTFVQLNLLSHPWTTYRSLERG
jgi:hypothetical protein